MISNDNSYRMSALDKGSNMHEDEKLYHEWLVGGDNNPNHAPSYSMSYTEYLERRVRKLENNLYLMTEQRDNLVTKVNRLKELRRSNVA